MDTSYTCPSCGNVNRDGAKYCDRCGARLNSSGLAAGHSGESAGPSVRGANWTAIIVILVVIAVAGWLLFGPKGNGGQSGTTAGGAMDNPHGDAGMDNPHGSTPGMEDVTSTIATSKQKLAEDPLDVESLLSLYQSYGMIGRGAQLRPYVDAALLALDERAAELGDEAVDIAMQIARGALVLGGDADAGRTALLKVHELAPDDLMALKLLGDVDFDRGAYADSIGWYTQYLESANAGEQGQDYWNARVDRATMYLRLGEQDGDPALTDAAVAELTEVTELQPRSFDAWFNLGNAILKAGDEAEAERIWEDCLALAADAEETWRAEAALAELRGEEAPPRPMPDSGMGMGGAPMGNPHGGMSGEPEGDA